MQETKKTNNQTLGGDVSTLTLFGESYQNSQEKSASDFPTTSTTLECRFCGYPKASVVLMPGARHYAAARCGRCDTFLQWLPQPDAQHQQSSRADSIERHLTSNALTEWERGFLTNIQKQKNLSPKQLAMLSKIEAKLGGAE
jgi:hypothetical protein